MVSSFFRVLIFFGGVWSGIVVILSIFGDPFLFLPTYQSASLFPPLHRYETFRLSFFTVLAFFSFQHILFPEKKFFAGQVLAIGLSVFSLVGLITVFKAGELGNEALALSVIALFALAFLYNSRTKIKKIWRR